MSIKSSVVLSVFLVLFGCKKAKIIDSCENNTIEISPSGYNRDSAMIFAPTAFTPNGDGLNDMFSPLVSGIAISSFEVFRKEKLIFTAHDNNLKWNGTDTDGNTCKDGVYRYVSKGKNATNGNFEIKGEISIITEQDFCVPCWFEDQIDPSRGFIYPTAEKCDSD